MSDLNSCPFCGVDMVIDNCGELMRVNGFPDWDDSFTWQHADQKLAIERDCPLEHEFHDTEGGLIRSWNTRAEVPFVTGTTVATDAPEIRYVPERTCKNLPSWSARENDFFCSECSYFNDHREPHDNYNYCPNCGARVVGE